MEDAVKDDRRRALEAVFGESSDNEGHQDDSASPSPDPFSLRRGGDKWPSWEAVEGIEGLWLCLEFLSGEQQSSLLAAIQREGWFAKSSHNQAMRFGDLPEWATELSRSIREVVCFGEVSSLKGSEFTIEDQIMDEACPLSMDLLWREPFFDQLIVNVYGPGEGICAHVDLMRFEDGIAIVSLESECVMHFTRTKLEGTSDETQKDGDSSTRIPVFLTPGSLVLMSGEARYIWKHEINRKPGFQLWKEKELQQHRRTSVTLRKLCELPK